jgi:hypothetical protein
MISVMPGKKTDSRLGRRSVDDRVRRAPLTRLAPDGTRTDPPTTTPLTVEPTPATALPTLDVALPEFLELATILRLAGLLFDLLLELLSFGALGELLDALED